VGPVALSQKHRIALYEHFVPRLGEDVTEALLAEFPAHDGDELVTKTFLRAEMAEQSAALRAEIADLRAEVHQLNNRTISAMVGIAGVMTAVLAVIN
jgi:hypothetical protein